MGPVARPPLALLLAVALATAPRPAVAGDLGDARKAMAKALASDDPAVRRTAFQLFADVDGKEAVDEIATVLGREADPVVQLAAVRALAGLRSKPATDELVAETKAAKGAKRLLLLLVFREQLSDTGKDLLLEVASGGDPAAAAQAALALGRKKQVEAAPRLLELLGAKDWQVRSAAARALGDLGLIAPKETRARLVDALAASDGRERTEIVAALETMTGVKGIDDDPGAWREVLAGKPAASVPRAPRPVAYVAGIPVRGRRVVLVVDHSVSTDDPHPFQDRERLQALCKVPGARDVPWFHLKTIADFLEAHAARLVADLPDGRSIGFVAVGGPKLDTRLARPVPATPGAKAAVAKAIEGLKPETGLDVLGSLLAALDAGGKDAAAWTGGPDEIVYLGCGVPWQAAIKDPPTVATHAGLRARLRMVPIHMVGVGNHNQEMYRVIADLSGGRYLDLSR